MTEPLDIPPRSDSLPEYANYDDKGCELYSACLHCPLPQCRYDVPGGAAALLRAPRDQRIRLLRAAGVEAVDIAIQMGISKRTVHRVLALGQPAPASE